MYATRLNAGFKEQLRFALTTPWFACSIQPISTANHALRKPPVSWTVLRIKDPGHPWKARGVKVEGEKDQLRVTVKKVAFYTHRVQLVLTFANLGERAITLLPYGRTVMRDNLGNVYRIIAVKDWRLTDRELFLGLRLAPSAQYTGSLNFELAGGASEPKSFDLTVAPALRDGADGPSTLDIGPITLS